MRLAKQKGAELMVIKCLMLDYVKLEHRRMIIGKVNEAENLFKHADQDHEATLDFNPDTSELMRLMRVQVQEAGWHPQGRARKHWISWNTPWGYSAITHD